MSKICKICKVRLTKENSYQTTFNLLCKTHYKERTRDYKMANKTKERKYITKYFKTQKGREALNMASKRTYQRFPEKWRARVQLREAVKKGELYKPEVCLQDSPLCYGKIEGHHFDYKQPLRATWLCTRHHAKLHADLDYLTSYYQGL